MLQHQIKSLKIILVLFLLLSCSNLWAQSISVDAGGYVGRWSLGASGLQQGNQTLQLSEGSYQFSLNNVAPNVAVITVDKDGVVSSSNPSVIKSSPGGELELVTYTVHFEVNGYPGRWYSGTDVVADTLVQGDQSFSVPPGNYLFSLVGAQSSQGLYSMDPDGNLSSKSPIFTVSGNALSLVTHTINFNLNNYPGRWWTGIDNIGNSLQQGDQSISVAPGEFTFSLMGVTNSETIYSLEVDGTLSSSSSLLDVEGNSLSLVTFPIVFDLNGYAGRWWTGVDQVGSSLQQYNQTISIAPGEYIFSLHTIPGTEAIYTVTANGTVTTESPLFTAEENQLSLVTHPIELDLNGYTGRWWSGTDAVGASLMQGDATLSIAPGEYTFSLQGIANTDAVYTVTLDGTVTTESSLLSAAENRLTLLTHPVEFDLNGYSGRWWSGHDVVPPALRHGDATLSVAPGEYTFSLQGIANTEAVYTVTLDGTVTTENPLLSVAENRLTVLTFPVNFDLAGYEGRWWSGADGVSASLYSGDNTIRLVPGEYTLSLQLVEESEATYQVALDGTLSTTDPGRLLVFEDTITFNTIPVDVQTQGYPGRWTFGAEGLGHTLRRGDDTVFLGAGIYSFNLTLVDSQHFQYQIDPSGEAGLRVEVLDSINARVETDDRLVIETQAVEIHPGDLDAVWTIADSGPFNGAQILCLTSSSFNFGTGGEVYPVSVDRLFNGSWQVTPSEISAEEFVVRFSTAVGNCGDDGCHFLGPVRRASINFEGVGGNEASQLLALSANGNRVVFYSRANNLIPGDTNNFPDVFVKDNQSQKVIRASVSSSGEQGNAQSTRPDISGDGNTVAFVSAASNLVPGDTNGFYDIFVHNIHLGLTERISVSSLGVQADDASSYAPYISYDGQIVAFNSSASNLTSDSDGTLQVYLRDRLAGQTILISKNANGELSNRGSHLYGMSADGARVLFLSDSSNLVSNDTNRVRDIFVYDRPTDQVLRVSVSSTGEEGNLDSIPSPSISADGQIVSFQSFANNLVPGIQNDQGNLFIHDLETRQTTRILDYYPGKEALSESGRYVLGSVSHQFYNFWIYDRILDRRCLIEFPHQYFNHRRIWDLSLSDDGTMVSFSTKRDDLVPNDSNSEHDVFTYRLKFPTYGLETLDTQLRFPNRSPEGIAQQCEVLPDCGLSYSGRNPDGTIRDWEAEFQVAFADPRFPKFDPEEGYPGVGFYLPFNPAGVQSPIGNSYFEPDDFALELIPDEANPGESFSLTDFIEIPFDLDDSGLVGDSGGEGVYLFFAYPLGVISELAQLESVEFVIHNQTNGTNREGIYSVSELASGIQPIPQVSSPVDQEFRSRGCVSFCELEEGEHDNIVWPQLYLSKVGGESSPGLIVGQHSTEIDPICDNGVTDILLPERSILEVSQTCAGGFPTQVEMKVQAGGQGLECVVTDSTLNEVEFQTIEDQEFHTVTFENANGIVRIEIIGIESLLFDVCWDCNHVVEPVAIGTTVGFDSDSTFDEDGNLNLGGVIITHSAGGEGEGTLLRIAEPNSEDEDFELLIPDSINDEEVTYFNFHTACVEEDLMRGAAQVSLRLTAQEVILIALDENNEEVDRRGPLSYVENQFISLSSERGIFGVEVLGTGVRLREIVHDCPEPLPSTPLFRRSDANMDGTYDITDPITILTYLFLGGFDPTCLSALDYDDSDQVDLTDAINSIGFLFIDGQAPAPPGLNCGEDPTEGDLNCESYPPCEG